MDEKELQAIKDYLATGIFNDPTHEKLRRVIVYCGRLIFELEAANREIYQLTQEIEENPNA